MESTASFRPLRSMDRRIDKSRRTNSASHGCSNSWANQSIPAILLCSFSETLLADSKSSWFFPYILRKNSSPPCSLLSLRIKSWTCFSRSFSSGVISGSADNVSPPHYYSDYRKCDNHKDFPIAFSSQILNYLSRLDSRSVLFWRKWYDLRLVIDYSQRSFPVRNKNHALIRDSKEDLPMPYLGRFYSGLPIMPVLTILDSRADLPCMLRRI